MKNADSSRARLPINAPTPTLPEEPFSAVLQGEATNALTKFSSKGLAPHDITGHMVIKRGNTSVKIENFRDLATGFKVSTAQLLDAMTLQLTRNSAKSATVAMSLEEYMALGQVKNRRDAYRQAAADLEVLFNSRLSYVEKKRGQDGKNFLDLHICESKAITNGIIYFTFGSTIFTLLKGYRIMQYPPQLFHKHNNRNPHRFYLGRKIAEHKNMNYHKANADIIAVKTLLAICPELPTYEEVIKTDRRLGARIIDPFERDMDSLSDIFSWHYCHSNGSPLTKEETDERPSYEQFAARLVKVTWNQYPDRPPKSLPALSSDPASKERGGQRTARKRGGGGQPTS